MNHLTMIDSAEITPDYPLEDDGWVLFSRMHHNGWMFNEPIDLSKYEYRVQRRPIKPTWTLEVGLDCIFENKIWEVLHIDDKMAWITRKGYSQLQPVSNLTQPPEETAP